MEVNGVTEDKEFMDAMQREVGVLFTSNIYLSTQLQKAQNQLLKQAAQAETDKEHYNAIVLRLQTAENAVKELQEASTDPKINRTLNRATAKGK